MKKQIYVVLALGLLSVAGSIVGQRHPLATSSSESGSSMVRYNPGEAARYEGMTNTGEEPVFFRRGERGMYPALHSRSEEPVIPSQEGYLMYPGDKGPFPALTSQEEAVWAREERERRRYGRRAHGKGAWGKKWGKKLGHHKAWGTYEGAGYPGKGPKSAKWHGHPWHKRQQAQKGQES